MIGLGLIIVGAVAVDRHVPIEEIVARQRIVPADRAGVVLGVGCIDRRALIERALRGGRDRPAIELADVVLVVLEDRAELHLVAHGRPHRELHQPAGDLVAGVADLGARAVFVVALRAVDRSAENIDVARRTHAAEHRAEAAILVGAVGAAHVDTPALAGTQHILDILGAERHHAADRAGAVDVGGRAAHDIDAADELWIEEEGTVGIVSGALVILPRTVDDHGDTTEILQAANVDRGRRVVAAILKRHAGHVVKDV